MKVIYQECFNAGYSEREIKLEEIIPYWKEIPESHRTSTALSIMLIEKEGYFYYKFHIIKSSESKEHHFDLHTKEILRSDLLQPVNKKFLYNFYNEVFKNSKKNPFKVIRNPNSIFEPIYERSTLMLLRTLGTPQGANNFKVVNEIISAIEKKENLHEFIINYFLKEGYITKEEKALD